MLYMSHGDATQRAKDDYWLKRWTQVVDSFLSGHKVEIEQVSSLDNQEVTFSHAVFETCRTAAWFAARGVEYRMLHQLADGAAQLSLPEGKFTSQVQSYVNDFLSKLRQTGNIEKFFDAIGYISIELSDANIDSSCSRAIGNIRRNFVARLLQSAPAGVK